MGLYTGDELDTPAFTEGITDWPEGVTAHEFWREIGTGDYTTPNLPKSTKLRDPLHRILHRAIAYTITSHSESSGSVTLTDLFYLYCIVSGRPCQLAERLARFLFSIRHARTTQAIYGGGYVYRLATAMGVLSPDQLGVLTLTSLAIPIDMAMIIRMRVARKEGTRYTLLDSYGRPWEPPREGGGMGPPEAEPARDDPGASGSGTQQEETVTPAPQPTPPRHSTPAQEQPLLVYRRTHSASISRLTAAVARIQESQAEIQQSQAEMQEMQRLEYAHAEAYREYNTRMLHVLLSGAGGPVPDPPAPPQRLREYYMRAGTSETHQQPPQ